MGDTLVPMLFVLAAAFYYYGPRALTLTLVSVISCIIFEYLTCKFMKSKSNVGDLSAVVTGMILALNLPVTAPLWMPAVGALFAMIIVKQFFGGIGRNIFNPAAAAVAFLMVSWPGIMSAAPLPFGHYRPFATPAGVQMGRAALDALKTGIRPDNTLTEMFLGYTPGYLGVAPVFILLVGFLVLLYRRIANWQVPLGFLGSMALIALMFPRCPSGRLDSVLYELTSGAAVFAAMFMATDPVTTPVTKLGRFLFGLICGVVTMLLRYFGTYPEGVYFAILLANPFVLVLDRFGWKLRKLGGGLDAGQKQA